MAFVDWSEQYSVKLELLDAQHKKLFQIVNHLHDAIFARKAQDEVGGIVLDLLDYTRTHFAEEERQMELHHFPEDKLQAHKAAHHELERKVHEIEQRLQHGEANISPDVMCFLVGEWLLKHILTMDKQYAPFMK